MIPNKYLIKTHRTSYTSVLTIVAFSMERYLAICHPLHSYAMSGLKRAVRIIAVVWVISFLAALPFAMFTTVDYLDFPPGNGEFASRILKLFLTYECNNIISKCINITHMYIIHILQLITNLNT